MDLCYSDSLQDFRGCFFNYHMNRYLSTGMDPDEFLKVFDITNLNEIRKHLSKRHECSRPRHALLKYRDFCKSVYLTEVQIRDFFAMCFWYVKWCLENLPPHANPFPAPLVREILQDLAEIVYRKDSVRKITEIMREAHVRLQGDWTPGTAFLVCEDLFKQILHDWNVEHDYAGDDHGQRLKRIFCAESVGHQKCANTALYRGFHSYFQELDAGGRGDKFPRAKWSDFQKESEFGAHVNSFFLFVNNPLNLTSLEQEFMHSSKVISIGSRADFWNDFPHSVPDQLVIDPSGATLEQRTYFLVALAAGKNFLHSHNPNCNILAAAAADVAPFGDASVSAWVDNNVTRGFGLEVDWEGREFSIGQARPGLYIDALTLADLVADEETLAAEADEAYRRSIVGMAPKALKGVTVPGEVKGQAGPVRKRKRKRASASKIDTGEDGNAVRKPFAEPKKVKTPDPKQEEDNSTIMYAVMGIGAFLGILFFSNKA